MSYMFARIKKFIHTFGSFLGILDVYHAFISYVSAIWYRFPSYNIGVIGVTGTNGKSTVTALIAHALQILDGPVGETSTVRFRIGEEIKLNTLKMTMPGRSFLHRTLRKMLDARCRWAVIETSSEGLRQYRHLGIAYDIAVFTNLTPEHLESHRGMDNYRWAKARLFASLKKKIKKNNSTHELPHTLIVANADSPYAAYYASFPAGDVHLFSAQGKKFFKIASTPYHFRVPHDAPGAHLAMETGSLLESRDMPVRSCAQHIDKGSVMIEGVTLYPFSPGGYMIENYMAAYATLRSLGFAPSQCADALNSFSGLEGRWEWIQKVPFGVIIDYAPEPYALSATYSALDSIPYKRLIHILGSAGGGRDTARRPILGRMAAEKAAIVVVTNEDPYDENPIKIMEEVAAGARNAGKIENKDLFIIHDRLEAFSFAAKIAHAGDLILSTGKGSEQLICEENGKKIPWDERKKWKQVLGLE